MVARFAEFETYCALFDTMGVGIFVADVAGEILRINAGGASALGYDSPADIVGASPSRLLADALTGARVVLADLPLRFRASLERSDGSLLPVEILLTVEGTGDTRRLAGVFHDLTDGHEVARRLAERNAELEALRQLAVDAMRFDEEAPLVRAMLALCRDAVRADGGGIYLFNPATKRLELAAYEGMSVEFANAVKVLKLGEGFTGKVAVSRVPLLIDHLSDQPEVVRPIVREQNVRNFACFPLLVKDRLLGVMNLFTHTDGGITGKDFSLLNLMSAQVSLSLDHVMRMDELRERNEELERFNQLAVDRELRMVELKQRIRELEVIVRPSDRRIT